MLGIFQRAKHRDQHPVLFVALYLPKYFFLTRIGLISDTHGYLDEQVFKYFTDCDEIWHAGDFGAITIADQLTAQSGLPLKGVYGNIDGYDVRSIYPKKTNLELRRCKSVHDAHRRLPGEICPQNKTGAC